MLRSGTAVITETASAVIATTGTITMATTTDMEATGTIMVTGAEVTSTSRSRQLRVDLYSPNTRRLCSFRISSAMLVLDRRTSSANGAFGRQDRHESAVIRLVTAASR